MNNPEIHRFHIPVLGLAYSIDTPLKVARFGISSVLSVMDDQLLEDMREHHCRLAGESYTPIGTQEEDYRAKRITAYLDLAGRIVAQQTAHLRSLPFAPGNELTKYFELLPEPSFTRITFLHMLQLKEGSAKQQLQMQLRQQVQPGSIDVNIMAKIDKTNYDAAGNPLPAIYSDALAALRGYAQSSLSSSVIFSAGYNPGLYAYLEVFADFYPDEQGHVKKKIILKVSDFRSAAIQGNILAKKGLWVSEFRIESGLNCGGHAFATDGLLMGPILQEFKDKRKELAATLFAICEAALKDRGRHLYKEQPPLKITAQGGIGTAAEQAFLLDYYELDRTGWGSPFLLVPEATNVDDPTLQSLATAAKEDYYLSNASPLGVLFNNFRKSSSEKQRQERIQKGRPGSPCYKNLLASDTEFTALPLCTASRKYQYLKLRQLQEAGLSAADYEAAYQRITEKDCICEGLATSVRLKEHLPIAHKLTAVTICPGPNLAYFSGVFSLAEMTGHIYGRNDLRNTLYRPHMFINELHLYLQYFKDKLGGGLNTKQVKSLTTFRHNLLSGIDYYRKLLTYFGRELRQRVQAELDDAVQSLQELIPQVSHP